MLKVFLRIFMKLFLMVGVPIFSIVASGALINPPATIHMGLMSRSLDKLISYEWVDLDQLPPAMVEDIVRTYDPIFCRHQGVDNNGWIKAYRDWRGGREFDPPRTLTMRAIRYAFLWPGEGGIGYGVEVLLAPLADLIWPKRRIAEMFLNLTYYGNGVYGAGAASKVYLQKNPDALGTTDTYNLSRMMRKYDDPTLDRQQYSGRKSALDCLR